MSAAAFLRLKKLKRRGVIAAAAAHNRRAIQAECGASAAIDPARSHLNETLLGPATAYEVAHLARDRMQAAGLPKLRKDAVLGIEVIFSLPANSGLNDRQFFSDCATWVGLKFGGPENVLSADIHRDEAAPHCHVLILPLIDGKMVGSDMVGNRAKLLALQQDFHRSVAGRYGLRKAPARLAGSAKSGTVATVLSSLNGGNDPALRSKAWPAIRDAIDRDPAPFAMTLGIEPAAPARKLRTMTQIFTSKGKGSSVEKPIGFEHASGERNLCTVGFQSPAPPSVTPAPATAPARAPAPAPASASASASASSAHEMRSETTRERECEQDPAMYDSEIGEFRRLAELPALARAGLTVWSDSAIEMADATDASNDADSSDWDHQA